MRSMTFFWLFCYASIKKLAEIICNTENFCNFAISEYYIGK